MAILRGLVGVFVYLDDVLSAIQKLNGEKIIIRNVYSPVKSPEILEAMQVKPSRIRLVSLIAGILGGCSGLALATYAHLSWNLITSGKPILPWIPWVVIFFEVLILVSVLSTVAALLIAGRIPRINYDKGGYNPRFSGDRFGIEVHGSPGELDRTRVILEESGAEGIDEI
jgi:Alternative complex III, ActD subunit